MIFAYHPQTRRNLAMLRSFFLCCLFTLFISCGNKNNETSFSWNQKSQSHQLKNSGKHYVLSLFNKHRNYLVTPKGSSGKEGVNTVFLHSKDFDNSIEKIKVSKIATCGCKGQAETIYLKKSEPKGSYRGVFEKPLKESKDYKLTFFISGKKFTLEV